MVSEQKIRVHVKATQHFYIHHDLASASFYFLDRVNERAKNDDRNGIGFEIMAGLVMLAFTLEANFNVLGTQLFKSEWNDYLTIRAKIKTVCDKLGYPVDFEKRPLQTIATLTGFRNELAHGKPITKIIDEFVMVHAAEVDQIEMPRADWEKQLDVSFLATCNEDVFGLWEELCNLAGIDPFETMTRGFRSIHHVTDESQIKSS